MSEFKKLSWKASDKVKLNDPGNDFHGYTGTIISFVEDPEPNTVVVDFSELLGEKLKSIDPTSLDSVVEYFSYTIRVPMSKLHLQEAPLVEQAKEESKPLETETAPSKRPYKFKENDQARLNDPDSKWHNQIGTVSESYGYEEDPEDYTVELLFMGSYFDYKCQSHELTLVNEFKPR